MPFSPIHSPDAPAGGIHIGMRKVKSLLAVFVGFLFWQLLRLLIPELEVHPIFIYIYGMIEIRESSEKTMDYGKMRILATVLAVVIGIAWMFIYDGIAPLLTASWLSIGVQIATLLLGALVVLLVAELMKCRAFCGLAATIYLILMVSHFESSMYLFSIMRAVQTIVGVVIAWIINVKLFPYPAKPRPKKA